VKAIRGFSDFGYSYVYVIFDEGRTSIGRAAGCWSICRRFNRSCRKASKRRSARCDRRRLGVPVRARRYHGQHSLADLRSLEDWHIRFELQSVPGVAEVASVGGFVRQYQITVDPNKLASYGIPLMQVSDAVRRSNNEVGGRLIEWSGAEYMVRAHGYVRGKADLDKSC